MADTGDYRCIASHLGDLAVHGSEPAELALLGFVEDVEDVVLKRDDVSLKTARPLIVTPY